jgi:molybdopterin molybdotransferase
MPFITRSSRQARVHPNSRLRAVGRGPPRITPRSTSPSSQNVDMPQALLSISEARERVLAATPRLEAEEVAIATALGRVLARPVQAAGDTPPFPNSAMDGYAVMAGPADRELELVGESRAGHPAGQALAPGQAIRISTGAVLPDGAEAVIRQEDVSAHDRWIVCEAATAPGDNVRRPGEDMHRGIRVLEAGTRLGPAELAAAVTAGAGRLSVARAPRVRVLCTGDELREPGTALAPGQIHNSNEPMLVGLALRAGANAAPGPRLADEREATVAALADALHASDVVVVSGGVSVGPHDHVKPALLELGVREHFWRVALQPGKPTWFGTRADTLVFGLPGNPVSAFVTFSLFVAPALAALQGRHLPARTGEATLESDMRRNPQRDQAIRVRLIPQAQRLLARPTGLQDSHVVSSLLGADALAMIPAGSGILAAGTPVVVLALDG